jgi:hypothetical protein|tara:strand:+ start:1522 stop:1623 length:102 start_codon:yes stop_codon:yes gene_type:complete
MGEGKADLEWIVRQFVAIQSQKLNYGLMLKENE